MAKSILFIDPCCPKPYDHTTIAKESLGGTEATVARIAEGLASRDGLEVFVEQKNRSQRAWFRPPDLSFDPLGCSVEAPDHVVCLREANALSYARKRFPAAKLHLWSHDLYTADHAREVCKALTETQADRLICVSNYHREQILAAMSGIDYRGKAKIRTVYNPVDAALKPSATSYDPYLLSWFSSPHKGLVGAIEIFKELKKQEPRFTFAIHNPGYYPDLEADVPGVKIMPKGTFFDALETVRSSLAVFYPNTVFPETFGLVFAEADTVGTPVLTHAFGAATEVLDHPQETMDCTQENKVVDRIMSWTRGARPIVRGKPQFTMRKVLNAWETLLNDS